MRDDILNRESEVLIWIEQDQSKAYICRQLRCKPLTLDQYLNKMGIDYKGNRGLRGKKIDPKRKTAKEYASKKHGVKSHTLKEKLIDDGIKERLCEQCKRSEWMGSIIPLELHHIDGDRFNNQFNNLQILCPNCHSQLHYYKSQKYKDKKIARQKRKTALKSRQDKKCLDCSDPCSYKAIRCKSCATAYLHKVNGSLKRPDKNVLEKDLLEFNSNKSAVGRKYGVTCNAVIKWIKYYNL